MRHRIILIGLMSIILVGIIMNINTNLPLDYEIKYGRPKLEDMLIEIPFVVHVPHSSFPDWEIIRLTEKTWTWLDLYGDSVGTEVEGGLPKGWLIVDWFDLEEPCQPNLCFCDVVLLMQGGCKCGGR
jgi:hypothetical protein